MKSTSVMLAMMLAAAVSVGAAPVSKTEGVPALKVRDWAMYFNAGLEGEYMKYEEPDIMKETGFQGGIFAEASIEYKNMLVIKPFMSLVGGDLDYDGSIHYADGRTEDFKVSTPNTIYNFRGTAGYKIPKLPFDLIPYAGLGYRYLYNDLASDRPEGYKRYQHYFYLPVGVEAQFNLGPQWSLYPRVEFDLLLVGKNRSMSVDLTQNSGTGFRASCDVVAPEWGKGKKMPVRLSIQPFVEYWNIGESDTVRSGAITLTEPKNNTLSTGLRVSARF
ncbi:MAG: outer membrane beta-barrel protein [Lentisphaerota bacterium]